MGGFGFGCNRTGISLDRCFNQMIFKRKPPLWQVQPPHRRVRSKEGPSFLSVAEPRGGSLSHPRNLRPEFSTGAEESR